MTDKITKKSVIIACIIVVSILYFLVGTPSFYEKYLGSFTEGGTFGFLAPSVYQFAVTLVLFFLLPMFLIKNVFHEKPRDYGWQAGNRRAGWLVLSWGIPLVVILAWFSSSQPEFRQQYPLFISQLSSFPLRGQNITVFILYEFTYIFYYIGWEFFFRGFALFGLKDSLGTSGALILQAVISTLLHLSKPMPELIMALPGGIIFGLVALRCRSIRSVIIAHWLLGFSLDLFILIFAAQK
ncbi:MAG: CPBP family intramembrane glutamic endopeptidase [Candidatus Auribacterota bacterium]|nr:CPBP family intramembrane glutamic endopeptidase [Candidatus Auribacterota bacterium]